MKFKVILLSIILFGILLRVLFINSSPPALYGDELTIALDAYSLLKTGHDQLGNFLPLTFPMGAGRPAGYVYGSIPFIAAFGPTEIGVRALSILSGIGILFLLLFIGKRVFSQKIGLLAAGIGAVSLWDISLSRGGFEAHFALFLALLGIYLFLLAKQRPVLYIFSALSFGLTLHTYPTYKLSLLPFLPLLFWFEGNLKEFLKKKHFFLGTAIFISLGALALSQTFIGGSEKRFSDINIFSQDKLKDAIEQKINFERQVTGMPRSIAKYFHNKPVEYAKLFLENYMQNFSTDFLILHGDRNPRHNMATMGEIYFAEIILVFIGLFSFWQRQKKIIIFLILWILMAAIPTAVVGVPHALRSSFMLPPLIILSALGLSSVLNYKKAVLYLILLLFIVQFAFFIQKLFFLAPNEYSNFWSYPAKLASGIAIQNKEKYDYIFLSDRIDNIEFAYPVYAKIEPLQIISQNRTKTALGPYSYKKYENIYIGNIPDGNIREFLESLNGSALYIGTPDVAKYLQDYDTVNGINGFDALVLTKHT